jgi:sirohydrochlorin cobaltochelatase
MRGIVLFAHGSRDAQWAEPFQQICNRIRSSRPEYPIALAFLEHMKPTLEEAVASLVGDGASAITVFPLFMAQGGHLKQDLPRLIDAIRPTCPHVPICLERAAGEIPEILDAIAAWILARAD